MTEREAIKYLTLHCLPANESTNLHKAVMLAISALEKRTPKRNLQKSQYNDNLFSVRCPSCSAHLGTYNKRLNTFTYAHSKYCPDCGQAIDWSEPYTEEDYD